MPYKECGCTIPDDFKKVDMIEKYQTEIYELYEKKPVLKAKIRELKKKRDALLGEILSMLEEKEYWLRRELLRDRGIPIDWRTLERDYGEENAEATDEE